MGHLMAPGNINKEKKEGVRCKLLELQNPISEVQESKAWDGSREQLP